MKNIISLLLVLSMLFLVGCGCKHEWQDATCTEPKTCSLCGVTEGEPTDHNFNDATCTEPKTCSLCGVTEGEPTDHNFNDATCTSAKKCGVCWKLEGEALGHNYNEGYCTRCSKKDPNYNNLNNIGFKTRYGMDEWLKIDGYNFSKNCVTCRANISNPSFFFRITYDNYFQDGWIPKDSLVNANSVNSNMLEKRDTEPSNILSNDVIEYNGAAGRGPVTIFERVVDSNKKLVIKIEDETYLESSGEYWYVPTDLLDFSTITMGEKISDYTAEYYINFK